MRVIEVIEQHGDRVVGVAVELERGEAVDCLLVGDEIGERRIIGGEQLQPFESLQERGKCVTQTPQELRPGCGGETSGELDTFRDRRGLLAAIAAGQLDERAQASRRLRLDLLQCPQLRSVCLVVRRVGHRPEERLTEHLPAIRVSQQIDVLTHGRAPLAGCMPAS